jgi:WD40 repeat protein
MRQLLLAVLLVAMTDCEPDPKPEEQPTTPTKEDQPTVPAATTTLKGHTSPVFSVSFSPNGTRIASRSRDKTIRLWDVAP